VFAVDNPNGGPAYNLTQIDAIITLCGDGSYCCGSMNGQANSTCCSIGQRFWIDQGKVYPYTLSSFTNAPPATTAASNCPSTVPTTASSQSQGQACSPVGSSSDSKLVLGVGLAVGLGIGIPFLILLVFVLVSRKKQPVVNSHTFGNGAVYPAAVYPKVAEPYPPEQPEVRSPPPLSELEAR
jgi:hypothetical protein